MIAPLTGHKNDEQGFLLPTILDLKDFLDTENVLSRLLKHLDLFDYGLAEKQ